MKKISNLVSQLQNGQRSNLFEIEVENNSFILSVLNCLFEEGYIRGYQYDFNNMKKVKVLLKYDTKGFPVIKYIKILSKSSHVKYLNVKLLSQINDKYFPGDVILTTSKGILTHKKALQQNVGGQMLIKIF